jgi:hypothetical protein
MMSTAAVTAQMCCRCALDSEIMGSNLDQAVKVCVFDSVLSTAERGLATGHSLVQVSHRDSERKTGGPELHWHAVPYRCCRPVHHSPNASKMNTLNKNNDFLRPTILKYSEKKQEI